MLTIGRLIELALGPSEASKVDTSIPQSYFDGLNMAQREDVAGWYYDANNRIFGRLLTRGECLKLLHHRVKEGQLETYLMGQHVYMVEDWPCFLKHVEQGHIKLQERVHV